MQNAFIEGVQSYYRNEVLNLYLFLCLEEVREITAKWLPIYNEQRPHAALNGGRPLVIITKNLNQKTLHTNCPLDGEADILAPRQTGALKRKVQPPSAHNRQIYNRCPNGGIGTSQFHARSCGTPCLAFGFCQSAHALLHAAFSPRLTNTPLHFVMTSPPSGWQRNLHHQAVEHAGRK